MEKINQTSEKKNMSSAPHWRSSGYKFYALIFVFLVMACGNSETVHEHDTYTCPMHPTVIADRPGTCPVCGMDLVRKARSGEEIKITEDLARLLKSPGEAIVASINTIKGEFKSLPVIIKAQGIVTYDTRNIFTIPARAAGRLEKVYLKYAFQAVSKGQKIAEIYSPELLTAQRELLYLLENDPENTALINGAKTRLELLGISRRQISDLLDRKVATNTFAVYSPYSGYVVTGAPGPATSVLSQASAGSGMADGMGSATPAQRTPQPSAQAPPSGSLIREGDYVAAGQTLFTIVNNNALRIELDIPGVYGGVIEDGRKVEIVFDDDRTESATVDFVQPFFAEGQEFVKIRVYTQKTEGLHVGHLVNAKVHLSTTEGLWVPREAVLDLGLKKVVFLKERGLFKPKEVTTGSKSENMIEITRGLASSDEIAADAHFMVDSESFVEVGSRK